MGNKLFGVDIAKLIDQNVSPGVLPATLIKVSTVDDPADPTGPGIVTETSHAARGFIESKMVGQADGTSVQRAVLKVSLVGDSIADGMIPEPNDKVTIEGATYRIVEDGVERDPAAAMYVCTVRPV